MDAASRSCFLLLCWGILLSFSACSTESELGERAARERLKNAFRAAHESRDPDALLDLYWLEGVESRTRAHLRLTAAEEIILPIRNLRVRDLEGTDGISYVHEGRRFGPTLPPRLRLEVEYDTTDRFSASYLIGFRDGSYYLITSRPVPDGNS